MKKRILVVDDYEPIRDLIEAFIYEILQKNVNIYTASNGKEALKILKNKKFDLVISDVKMPIMDGIELLKKIEDMNDQTPVIMMSATQQASEFDDFKNIIGFLEKPFKIYELAELVLQD